MFIVSIASSPVPLQEIGKQRFVIRGKRCLQALILLIPEEQEPHQADEYVISLGVVVERSVDCSDDPRRPLLKSAGAISLADRDNPVKLLVELGFQI